MDKSSKQQQGTGNPRSVLKSDQQRLEFQIALVNAILEASPDGVLVVDNDGTVVAVNQRFFELWSMPRCIVQDREGNWLTQPDDAPLLKHVVSMVKDPVAFHTRVQELYADPSEEDFTEIELTDGRTIERHSRALYGHHEQYLGRVWFFGDITEHIQQEHSLQELAHTDVLTGIGNRRYLEKRGREEINLAQRQHLPLAVLLCDLDYFKQLNDKWGHHAGDVVLQALANHFTTTLRDFDIPGRLGGDEFAVILPGTDTAEACRIAERLRQGIEQLPVAFKADSLQFSITCGVTELQASDSNLKDLLHRADAALYRAKQQGRNRVECSASGDAARLT